MPSAKDLEERLCQLALSSPWFFPALQAARDLRLDAWCIGAGAVRNLVSDHLHGYAQPSQLSDLDLAYFDATELAPEHDALLQQQLMLAMPEIAWEVTNQASVHTWFEQYFGHAVLPLASLHEAVASWPEYATSVGLCLKPDLTIEVIAPYGLDNLFNCVVRRNPARVSPETYRARIAHKNYAGRWPGVTIVRDQWVFGSPEDRTPAQSRNCLRSA